MVVHVGQREEQGLKSGLLSDYQTLPAGAILDLCFSDSYKHLTAGDRWSCNRPRFKFNDESVYCFQSWVSLYL